MLVCEALVEIAYDKLPHGLRTDVQLGVRLVEQGVNVPVDESGVGGPVYENVGVKKISHRLHEFRVIDFHVAGESYRRLHIFVSYGS